MVEGTDAATGVHDVVTKEEAFLGGVVGAVEGDPWSYRDGRGGGDGEAAGEVEAVDPDADG